VQILDVQRGDYLISTDPSKLDLVVIHGYLSNESYWAQGRPLDVMRRALQHSLCFGVYLGHEQVGLARVVTDYATFAWLCDVFILEAHRGQGLGKWLIQTVVAHRALQGVLTVLGTRDAHGLYQGYGGFEPMQDLERWMLRPRRRPGGHADDG
jgi:GNAT superfamily N-acetyltransferase